ncbi:2-dehydropantoate 2-reductase [Streptomyces sp. NPDC001941]|uniref:2-dehydropantoate 2-reductase n=1 Tax=Streptomyces sp. NPDC001941 TaxID=3154659 RepID=UPI00331B8D8B
MRILVVGAGATGGFYGAKLARAGHDVTFLVRPRRAEALRARGLRLLGPGDAEDVLAPRLVTADALAEPYDVVLLSVKALALKRAVEDVAPAIGPGTAVVPLLNGMAHLDELNARHGADRVLGGVAKCVTTVNAEGDIVVLAPLAVLEVGEQGGGAASERVAALRAALTGAGVESPETADVVGAMWAKWVFITSASAVTCLLRAPVGDVVAVPGGADFARAVVAEGAAVAAAAGHPVARGELDFTLGVLTQERSPFATSMYRDVADGHQVEVEHVFGDLLLRARALGVATPLLDTATLYLRVHQHRVSGG